MSFPSFSLLYFEILQSRKTDSPSCLLVFFYFRLRLGTFSMISLDLPDSYDYCCFEGFYLFLLPCCEMALGGALRRHSMPRARLNIRKKFFVAGLGVPKTPLIGLHFLASTRCHLAAKKSAFSKIAFRRRSAAVRIWPLREEPGILLIIRKICR